MTDPFLICTLSRSRTKWLSTLLTHGVWTCHCEVAIGMREVSDVARFFARPHTGSAETAVAPAWDLLRHLVPNLRGVVVRRPVDDAVASMAAALSGVVAFDPDVLRRNITLSAKALDRVARSPGVLVVDFADLNREDVCGAIFNHCLGEAMPHDHWAGLRDRNIQVSVASLFRYYELHRAGVDRFKAAVRSELRSLVRSGAVVRAAA